jgi:hypothetical protein
MHDMPPNGDPETLRAILAEQLWFIGVNAEIGIRYTETGDDTGLAYSIRRIIASTRLIVATGADLCALVPPPSGRDARKWTTGEAQP